MPTLDFPTSIRPARVRWKLRTNTQIHRSPLSGVPTTYELPGARWEAVLEFRDLRRSELVELEVLLAKLRGPAGRVRVWNHAREVARGVATGEVESTNLVRNNTMQGAVVGVIGSGGARPTHWSQAGVISGLSSEVVAFGEEDGINYIDYRWYGTPVVTSNTGLYFEHYTELPVSVGDTYTSSCFVTLAGGSIANIDYFQIRVGERGPSDEFLADARTSFVPAVGDLANARKECTHTMQHASVEYARCHVVIGFTEGQPIDITLRIGMPQFEKLPFASSVIKTFGAARTRPGPSVDGADQTGTTLETFGWTPNTLFILRAGDMFEVNGELKMLTEDAHADAWGRAPLTFEPPLRNSPPDCTPINTTRPSAVMMLADDDQVDIDYVRSTGSLSLRFIEAIE